MLQLLQKHLEYMTKTLVLQLNIVKFAILQQDIDFSWKKVAILQENCDLMFQNNIVKIEILWQKVAVCKPCDHKVSCISENQRNLLTRLPFTCRGTQSANYS